MFYEGIKLELNNKDYTACVVGSENTIGDVLIPASIFFDSNEYFITCIKEESFKDNQAIKSISFPKDSKLCIIERNAFINSSLQSLSIPSSVQYLIDGWCNDTANLVNVYLSSENKHYKYLDEDQKVIIGKSKINENESKSEFEFEFEFDEIVFCSRDIEKVYIPSFIRRIGCYSFSKCVKLSTVNISFEANIKEISTESFSNTKIVKFTLPSSVEVICAKSFAWCDNLRTIEIDENSELRKIEENAFFESSIESLFIPQKVDQLDEGWCNDTWNLNHVSISQGNESFKFIDEEQKLIVGKSNIESSRYDKLVFASHDIEEAVIPSNIKHLCSFCFSWCKNLQKVDFFDDSELETIGESAFSDSSIVKLSIPKSVKVIRYKTFWWCRNLIEVDFPADSELSVIEKDAFTHSSLSKLTIPSSVVELRDGWCNDLSDLVSVGLSSDNERFRYLDDDRKVIIGKSEKTSADFDAVVFACRDVEKVTIPSSVRLIDSHALSKCDKMEEIEFGENSCLMSVGVSAFSYSSIVEIVVPKSVKKIQSNTFYRCNNLEKVSFSSNSELISIDKNAFFGSALRNLSIPSSVQYLIDGWCNDTPNLINVYLSSENKHYKYLDEDQKVIIGKSKINENESKSEFEFEFEFDEIVFCSRDIEKVYIPSFIRRIGCYSFSKCVKLSTVNISFEANIKEISTESFSNTKIVKFTLPSSVEVICAKSFAWCDNLRTIEIDENSALQKIDEYAFAYSTLERISIPKNVSKCGRGAFSSCTSLQSLEFLGEELFFESFCFNYCESLSLASFPNSRNVYFTSDSFITVSIDFILFLCHDANVSCG